MAPLAVFNDGCAINEDFGFVRTSRAKQYRKIVDLVKGNADSAKVRSALQKLAKKMSADGEGVFLFRREISMEEVVAEFEAKLVLLSAD